MQTKIVLLVNACSQCPNHVYYSGGSYICKLTGGTVVDKNQISPACPLADYPSEKILQMEATISRLLDNR